jgi:hypothetical protein
VFETGIKPTVMVCVFASEETEEACALCAAFWLYVRLLLQANCVCLCLFTCSEEQILALDLPSSLVCLSTW